MAMRIDTGHLGDLNLAGLSWCGMFAWPKAVHEGNGEALVVISDHASPTQPNALPTILSGRETVPGATIFNVFATTFVKMHDPIFAPIEFELDLAKRIGRVKIKGVIDTSLEPIRNLMIGDKHFGRVVLPQGFEYREASLRAAERRRVARSSSKIVSLTRILRC